MSHKSEYRKLAAVAAAVMPRGRYAIDYVRGPTRAPWAVYRVNVAGCARVWLASFTNEIAAAQWIASRS